jgi:hypothetical protein
MSSEETKYQEWQTALEEIRVETDPEKLSEKLQKVESLIQQRLQDLYRKGDGTEEHKALKEALFALRIIKRDKLGFPDWQ